MAGPAALTCSLVVATRERATLLDRYLAAVARLEVGPDEVIVVDNSRGDETTSVTASRHGAGYVLAETGGQSAARDAGARVAGGDVIVFSDDDVIPDPDWLLRLLAPLAQPEVLVVAGRIMPTSVTSEAQRLFAETAFDFGRLPRTVALETPGWFEICNFGGFGAGTNMAFRRDAFALWPGFRESLGHGTPIPGNEEHYAFFQLVRLGHTLAYTPDAVVRHPFPETMDELRRLELRNATRLGGYATLLLVEEPEHRRDVLRFLRAAAVRRRPFGESADRGRTRVGLAHEARGGGSARADAVRTVTSDPGTKASPGLTRPTDRRTPARVVHLLSSGGSSGAAQTQIVRALAQGLDPEAFETEAWMLNEGGMLVPGLTAAGAHAEVVRFAGVRDPVGALRVGRALIRRRPAIIHLHIGGRARIALARRLTSARLVAHLWGAYADDGLTALPLDQLARRADVTIATSRAVGAAIDVPATVVYPGVDAAEHPGGPAATAGGRNRGATRAGEANR